MVAMVVSNNTLLLLFISMLLILMAVLFIFINPSSETSLEKSCESSSDCNGRGLCVKNKCVCRAPWSGSDCSLLGQLPKVKASSTESNYGSCSQTPTPCKSNKDCDVCSDGTEFVCQSISADENSKGVSGTFCLPEKPVSDCMPLKENSSNDQIPGKWHWAGWKDVETQGWSCVCEWPSFYPQSTSGACLRSSELCSGTGWQYPCIRDPEDPSRCLDLSCETASDCPDPLGMICENNECVLPRKPCSSVLDCGTENNECQQYASGGSSCKNNRDCPGGGICNSDKKCVASEAVISQLCGQVCVSDDPFSQQKYCAKMCSENKDCGDFPCYNGICLTNTKQLLGANPLVFGNCKCYGRPCSSDAECVGRCQDGICVGERTALNSSGLPICVVDECGVGGKFLPYNIPPYTYGTCECDPGYEFNGLTCVWTNSKSPNPRERGCFLGCGGHGTCVLGTGCQCDPGWRGDKLCGKFSCDLGCGPPSQGQCIGPNECVCQPQWKHEKNPPCLKDGDCKNRGKNGNIAKCVFPEGKSEGYCCVPNSDGLCVPTDDSNMPCTVPFCGCSDSTCTQPSCLNGGFCERHPVTGSVGCVCTEKWTGTHCEISTSAKGVCEKPATGNSTKSACFTSESCTNVASINNCSTKQFWLGTQQDYQNGVPCYGCKDATNLMYQFGVPSLVCVDDKNQVVACDEKTSCQNTPLSTNFCTGSNSLSYTCEDICFIAKSYKGKDFNALCSKGNKKNAASPIPSWKQCN